MIRTFRNLAPLATAAVVLTSPLAGQAPCNLTITPSQFNRLLPQQFVDQALESLPQTNPKADLLLSRKVGDLGTVLYGLVAYRPSATADTVVVIGAAVSADSAKAWDFQTTCRRDSWLEGLLALLEKVSVLK